MRICMVQSGSAPFGLFTKCTGSVQSTRRRMLIKSKVQVCAFGTRFYARVQVHFRMCLAHLLSESAEKQDEFK